jgi:hypothetical protein
VGRAQTPSRGTMRTFSTNSGPRRRSRPKAVQQIRQAKGFLPEESVRPAAREHHVGRAQTPLRGTMRTCSANSRPRRRSRPKAVQQIRQAKGFLPEESVRPAAREHHVGRARTPLRGTMRTCSANSRPRRRSRPNPSSRFVKPEASSPRIGETRPLVAPCDRAERGLGGTDGICSTRSCPRWRPRPQSVQQIRQAKGFLRDESLRTHRSWRHVAAAQTPLRGTDGTGSTSDSRRRRQPSAKAIQRNRQASGIHCESGENPTARGAR